MSRPAPGGASSICLGTDDNSFAAGSRQNSKSANNFSSNSNPNAGNVLTDRANTRVHQAPGGNSTICFGTDTAAERFPQGKSAKPELSLKPEDQVFAEHVSAPAGGNATIYLGGDSPTRMSTARGAQKDRMDVRHSPRVGAAAAGKGRATPGGASSIQFGQGQEVVEEKKKDQADEDVDEDKFCAMLNNQENAMPNVPNLPSPGKKNLPSPPKMLTEQYKERTTTRAPPGGQSNVIFG